MTALYGFAYTETALKYLERVVTAKVRAQIKRKISSLAKNATPTGCKKLVGQVDGQEPVFRIRSGDYRILYVIRPNQIVVLDIDHRKDVYR